MKRPATVLKSPLSPLFEQSAEAWRHQDYDRSIALLVKASELAPGNVRVLLDLGRAYGMRYDYPAAERCFEKAARLSPAKAETLTTAGSHAYEFGNFGMAAPYLKRAAGQGGVAPETLVRLAELYERQHRMDDASALVRRALELKPDCALAILAQCRAEARARQYEPAEARLRSLVRRDTVDAWTRARAWYGLGALLDRIARYDEAMGAFLEAKALLRPGAKQAALVLDAVQARVRELEQTVTTATCKRWHEAAAGLAPERKLAILCGHPRSGTTLLEQVLDSHPQIISAEETHILHDEAYLPLTRDFSPDTPVVSVLDSTPASKLRESRDNYFRCTELFLGKTLGDRLLLDKNPALNVLIPPILRIFPEAQFIVAIRDPRDVCLSCFMQPLTINPVSSAYLTLEGTARQYASVVGFWKTLLPRMLNPYLEVRYEDMVVNLEEVSRRTLQFLRVSWDPAVLKFDEHARGRLIRSPTYAEVTKPVFMTAVGRWKHYEKYLEPCMNTLQRFVEAFGYR